jgi:hypothetical protein
LRDIADVGPWFSCDEILRFSGYRLRLRGRPRIRRCPGPYPHLRMPRRRLPHGLLSTDLAAPNRCASHHTGRKDPTSHHNYNHHSIRNPSLSGRLKRTNSARDDNPVMAIRY